MSHTIILAQFTEKPQSRQYSDYETTQLAMDGKFDIMYSRVQRSLTHTNTASALLCATIHSDGLVILCMLIHFLIVGLV